MKWVAVLPLFLLFKSSAFALGPSFLDRFAQDPQSASSELPEKAGIRFLSKFDKEAVASKSFVTAKDQFRKNFLCVSSQPGEICDDGRKFIPFEGFNEDWLLRSFLGGVYETNIYRLSEWNQGQVAVVPWAGHYWPIYQGGIGARYGDPNFPRSESFKTNYKYYAKNYLKAPPTNSEELARLSPAEKYDYLIGDREWSLTQSVWTEGKSFLDSTGKVETWMGICHGWAPAAFVVPEPKQAFDLDMQNGRGVVRFYPHDLKGLVSQLWAQSNFNYNFLGGRCNDKNPKTDSNGRIISSECFDINPATWHLALIHWVGRGHKSFVLDATYDYEVWNQPISSYKLSYFNPESKVQGTLEKSLLSYLAVTKDPYKKYRSPNTKYLLGVISEIQYVVEEEPDQNNSISDPLSRLVTVSYYYDLELDDAYNVIGGEWYQQGHPDMLWKPAQGALARAIGEESLPDWQGQLPVPNDFFRVGITASAQKTPLSRILDKLVDWSIRR